VRLAVRTDEPMNQDSVSSHYVCERDPTTVRPAADGPTERGIGRVFSDTPATGLRASKTTNILRVPQAALTGSRTRVLRHGCRRRETLLRLAKGQSPVGWWESVCDSWWRQVMASGPSWRSPWIVEAS
jgi:hypothetical protein